MEDITEETTGQTEQRTKLSLYSLAAHPCISMWVYNETPACLLHILGIVLSSIPNKPQRIKTLVLLECNRSFFCMIRALWWRKPSSHLWVCGTVKSIIHSDGGPPTEQVGSLGL